MIKKIYILLFITSLITIPSCTVSELTKTGAVLGSVLIKEFSVKNTDDDENSKETEYTISFPERTVIFQKPKGFSAWFKKNKDEIINIPPYTITMDIEKNVTYFIIETESLIRQKFKKHFATVLFSTDENSNNSVKTIKLRDSNDEFITVRYLEKSTQITLIIKRENITEIILE